jgi:hypothetical protein
MSVGQNAHQAVVFLKTFYRDLHSMMAACQQLLDEGGWKPDKSSKIAELSNSLHRPHRWVLDSLFRSYLPAAGGGREALVLLVLLNAKHFDDVQVLAVRAHFQKPITHKRIWSHWTSGLRVLDYLTTDPKSTEIPEEVFTDGALPDASRAHGFLVPIDKLTDEKAVRQLLIEPLLKLP